MTWLLDTTLSNVALAGVLALVAWSAGRWCNRPALVHGLWLLVLLKLVTPPLFRVPLPWQAPDTASAHAAAPGRADLGAPLEPAPVPMAVADSPLRDAPEPAGDETLPMPLALLDAADEAAALPLTPAVPAVSPNEPACAPAVAPPPVGAQVVGPPPRLEAPAEVAAGWSVDLPPLLGGVWACGTVVWLLLAAWRTFRFGRLLRLAELAPADLQAETQDLAARLGVAAPRVLLVPGQVSPMLWAWAGQARLLMPRGLLARLTDDQRQAVLAHELAHWRRRDHLVRWLELIVLSLYWWCPLAWWARRQLQQAEEECCDAWVVWLLPQAARAYALALVETVDFLSGARSPLPQLASGIGHVQFLRRRLTMILRGSCPRALTLGGTLVVFALAALLLPLAPGWAQDEEQQPPPEKKDFPPKKGFKKDGPPDKKENFDKAHMELKRLHDELQEIQRELERKQRDLHKLMEKLHAAEDKERKGPPDGKEHKGPPKGPPDGKEHKGPPKGPPEGKDGKHQPKPPFAPKPDQPPHPPQPPQPPQGQGMKPFGPPGSVEHRLTEMERKLDMLLRELQELRKGGKQGPPFGLPKGKNQGNVPGTFGPGNFPPGAGPKIGPGNPPPRNFAPDAELTLYP